MKLIAGKIASGLIAIGGWLLFGGRLMLDLIGYSTVPEDVTVAETRLDQALELFFTIPWWGLLGFCLISTLWLMWVSWPRQTMSLEEVALAPRALSKKSSSIQILPTPEVLTYGEKGIYIARIFVETDKLVNDLIMHFVILGFNASGYNFTVDNIAGTISFVSKLAEGSNEKIELPTPRFASERGHLGKIANMTEFMYILEQRVPKSLVEAVIKSATEKHTEFYLDDLKVIVSAGSTKMRLPLWQAITIRKPWEQFSTGRIVFASAVAKLPPTETSN